MYITSIILIIGGIVKEIFQNLIHVYMVLELKSQVKSKEN